jgi:hypothetical protein
VSNECDLIFDSTVLLIYYRNAAIMELWNNGIMGFNGCDPIVKMAFAVYPQLQFPKTHSSNIPAFHHSIDEELQLN